MDQRIQETLSLSDSDSGATRLGGSDGDSEYGSEDDDLDVFEILRAAGGPARARVDPTNTTLIDLADGNGSSAGDSDVGDAGDINSEDEEQQAVDREASDDVTLRVGQALPSRSSSDSDDESAPIATKKRKRLRQGDSKDQANSTDQQQISKSAKTPPQPTIVIKPQPTECTVCYDPCTISGRHRLVSLKCGHVFGKKCIDRWVTERRTCPNCSAAVRKADIRPLFTDHVAVVDNSGVEDLTFKYDAEKSKRIQMETELSRTKLQLQLAQANAAKLKEEACQWRQRVADLQCRIASERFAATSAMAPAAATPSTAPPPQSAATTMWNSQGTAATAQFSPYTPTKNSTPSSQFSPPRGLFSPPPPPSSSQQQALGPPALLVPNDTSAGELFRFKLNNARVCLIAPSCLLVCVGESFSSSSFGIVKVSTADTRHAVRIPAHQSAVRDLSFRERDDLVLSVAFDGKLVVSNLRSDSVVMQYALPQANRNAWSCSFSPVDPFALYCGFHDGTISRYDMRRGASPVALYQLPVRQPVHSIQLCPATSGGSSTTTQERLVAATFGGFGVWTSDQLAVGGSSLQDPARGIPAASYTEAPNCCSLSHVQTQPTRLLVTTRTQLPATPAKHMVYDLPAIPSGWTGTPTGPTRPTLRSSLVGFKTPSVMSRSVAWDNREGKTMVASWDDHHKAVTVWDEASAQVTARLRASQSSSSTPGVVTIDNSQIVSPVVDIQHAVAYGDWRRSRALLGILAPQQLVVYSHTG